MLSATENQTNLDAPIMTGHQNESARGVPYILIWMSHHLLSSEGTEFNRRDGRRG